ncbi:hypothetical protein Aph02nite_18850 [Actinoplanes philippinensis]|uniref:Uncharacterized protein n=1 Tax=Actinoplanes philippinensis TaxID=35752 RepID=A0A1I2BJX3_9ACTN|nr:hypothetical protein [Actinoplanes philippinensis]GIE75935.1 hypothetical protein Aph02nite_18850 [Actinoplanes philippinensis]SFE56098.1 hypothetical protein SAMN05421541_102351 [Actinoplanes philippinensis]
MEPTSSPDNARPSPGLARFWQVRPEPEPVVDEPLETPADLLSGSPLGTFRSRPIPPLAPIASAARHPSGAADPFGLNRVGREEQRHLPEAVPADPERHGDPDHSVPPEDEAEPLQDVKSGAPESGFRLGGRAGRPPFGDDPEPAAAAADGEARIGAGPDDEESAGAAPDELADQTPPDAGQEAAEVAGTSDENGREDMNGRAGAPGYAQTGEAVPDASGDPAEEPAGQAPADPPRAAAGWASVPGLTQPIPSVPGAPVSPAYAPNPYTVADFTPDHPAGSLQPVSGLPGQAPEQAAPEPADPAAPAPVSPAPEAPAAPAVASAPVQIPATRTPPDLTIDLGDTGLTPAEGGYGFAPTGFSLGRPAEAFGVASVTPAAPPAGTVTPPSDFLTFPPAPPARRAREEAAEEVPSPRRSASLEDAEPARRSGRRAAPAEEPASADQSGEEPLIGRTIWDEDAARHFRAAWHEVKAEFVDDPVTALTRAHDLLTDAVNELTEVLLAERDELDPLRGTDTPDTESMRMAMRGYREFLDRILSL